MTFKVRWIRIGKPKAEWSEPKFIGKDVFIIRLEDRIK